jgi:hypothetical protein
VCSGQQVLDGYNDLATTHPELAVQADGWDPTTVSKGSNKKLGWICAEGHSWQAQVINRSKHGCPVCSGRQLLTEHNDLATTNPELAAQADGWDPTTVSEGSNKKVGWKCSEGHTWMASPNARSRHGCPICSGNQVLVGYNDLATTNPELAAQADGWDPTTISFGSKRKFLWKCAEGHNWNAPVKTRSRGNGCPSCAESGFDPNKDGWVYLLDNDELDMFQIGISNVPKDRLQSHFRGGWEAIELRGPMEGRLAQQLETEILHAIERRGAVLGHKTTIKKFDGYSEAWTKASLVVTSFKELLNFVYEDDIEHH